MTAPVSQRLAAGLVGAICLSVDLASPSAARDGAMLVAQNPPDQALPGQGEEHHRKDRGDKGQPQQQQQQGPQGAAPEQTPKPATAQPAPGPGPGPQGELRVATGSSSQSGSPRLNSRPSRRSRPS